MDFENSALFERSACFYVTITGNFERFQYFNFEANFLIRENFFQKKMEYRFLVESTKVGKATLPNSPADVKTKNEEYKMVLSQRTEFCQEPACLFQNFCFSFRTSYKELI